MNLLSENDIKVKEKVEAEVVRFGEMGIRTLAVAKMDLMDGKNEWKMIGLLTFLDPPRPDTKQTIVDANKYGMLEDRTEFLSPVFPRFTYSFTCHFSGVNVKMVTGDHLLIAKQTALTLNMGTKIFTSENLPMLDPETKQKPPDLGKTYGKMCLAADGFASMFPEHKVSLKLVKL
jgi:H+-transporting ATPase